MHWDGDQCNEPLHCLIAFLALHDKVVMMPPEEEKEHAKEYIEKLTCPEWQNRFLLTDGTKFILFQKPGLHGEAWFDKNKDYSICHARLGAAVLVQHSSCLLCVLCTEDQVC